jgi:hypothetical protein
MAAVSGPWQEQWWFTPTALGRVAMLRLLAYVLVPVDVLFTTSWVAQHGDVPGVLYRPVLVARLLDLPTPTRTGVDLHKWSLIVLAVIAIAAVVAGATRVVRLAGAGVAVLYLWWMFVAMSYGKVDHDRFGYLVLLAVLPTVGAARIGDRQESAAAGWAVRMAQVAAVATYVLAAWAKLRFGGWGWLNGATLARAVIRRGTWFSDWTLDAPWFLRTFQWAMVILELAAPVLLVMRSERLRVRIVAALYGFHVVTFLALRIIFLPHLVALAAFLPLERIGGRERTAPVEPSAPRIAGRSPRT